MEESEDSSDSEESVDDSISNPGNSSTCNPYPVKKTLMRKRTHWRRSLSSTNTNKDKRLNTKLHEMRELETTHIKLNKCLRRFFNEDQINAMISENNSRVKWSKATIAKAALIRESCGYDGYVVLLAQGYPLPDEGLLKRKSSEIVFDDPLALEELYSRVDDLFRKVGTLSKRDQKAVLKKFQTLLFSHQKILLNIENEARPEKKLQEPDTIYRKKTKPEVVIDDHRYEKPGTFYQKTKPKKSLAVPVLGEEPKPKTFPAKNSKKRNRAIFAEPQHYEISKVSGRKRKLTEKAQALLSESEITKTSPQQISCQPCSVKLVRISLSSEDNNKQDVSLATNSFNVDDLHLSSEDDNNQDLHLSREDDNNQDFPPLDTNSMNVEIKDEIEIVENTTLEDLVPGASNYEDEPRRLKVFECALCNFHAECNMDMIRHLSKHIGEKPHLYDETKYSVRKVAFVKFNKLPENEANKTESNLTEKKKMSEETAKPSKTSTIDNIEATNNSKEEQPVSEVRVNHTNSSVSSESTVVNETADLRKDCNANITVEDVSGHRVKGTSDNLSDGVQALGIPSKDDDTSSVEVKNVNINVPFKITSDLFIIELMPDNNYSQ